METIKKYNLSPALRILVICVVLVISAVSVLAGFPVAKLLGLSPGDFGGSNFQPSIKTISVIVVFAAFQFFLVWFAMRFVHKGSIKKLGFKGPIIKPLIVGTLIGLLWQTVEYLLIHFAGGQLHIEASIPQGISALEIIGYMLLNVLFLLTLNSLKEEVVFRTYPIEQFNDYPNLMIPIIVSVSLVFAAVHHILYPFEIGAFMSRFTIALVLSFVYYRWRSIWLIAGIHNGLNLLVYITSGNYKMGGLFNLTIENNPNKGVSILIDVFTAAVCIIIFGLVWNRKKNKQ